MPSLGPMEILVVLVVALLIFGPNKLPEVARQVGRAMREFNSFREHVMGEIKDVVDLDGTASPAGTPPLADPQPADRASAAGTTPDAAPDVSAGTASDPASDAGSDTGVAPLVAPAVDAVSLFGPGVGDAPAAPAAADVAPATGDETGGGPAA